MSTHLPWATASNAYGTFATCDCPTEHYAGCVQNCSQWSRPGDGFGSTPHDDRVLSVVLVVATRDFGVPSRVHRVEPNSAHADTFWQDIGRPGKGTEKHAEAPTAPRCVQPACPTGPTLEWEVQILAWYEGPRLPYPLCWGCKSARWCESWCPSLHPVRRFRVPVLTRAEREAHLARLELIGPLPEPYFAPNSEEEK